jgi:regulator of sigma E protease
MALVADGVLAAAVFGGGAVEYVLSAVVALGVLIFIHELGHFAVAKALGVGVERFSLGFGPRLWAFRRGETEYCVSAVPLGGYVKMTGEEAHGEDAIHPQAAAPPIDLAKSFSIKPLWARALIVFAGPAMNFVLAAAIFFALFAIVGMPVLPPTVGRVAPESPAAQAGLRPRDEIVAVRGRTVRHWAEIEEVIARSEGRPLELTVQRDGGRQTVTVTPRKVAVRTPFNEPAEAWSVGIRPYLSPVIGEVRPGMPAAEAGLQAGDRIAALNGQPVETWDDLAEAISTRAGETVTLTVERGKSRLDVSVTPRAEVERDPLGNEIRVGRIGIATATSQTYDRLDPVTALGRGLTTTWDLSVLTALSFWKLVTGAIPARNVGSVVQITVTAGQQAQQGFVPYARFVALISINLAILNLLPIPVLDGGHLLFFAIEAGLGRPLSIQKREIAQRIGLAVLLLVMGFALFNDLTRFLPVGNPFK